MAGLSIRCIGCNHGRSRAGFVRFGRCSSRAPSVAPQPLSSTLENPPDAVLAVTDFGVTVESQAHEIYGLLARAESLGAETCKQM